MLPLILDSRTPSPQLPLLPTRHPTFPLLLTKAAHDVSDESRDEAGEWTAGGTSNSSAKQESMSSSDLKVHSDAWIKTLTRDQKEAINTYTMDSSVNDRLRSGFTKRQDDDLMEEIDSALEASGLPAPMVVFRATSVDLEDGESYVEDGYTSASTHTDMPDDFAERVGGVVVAIKLPKGFPAASIAKLSQSYSSEGEVLIPRGTEFRRAGTSKDGRQVWEPVFDSEPVAKSLPFLPRPRHLLLLGDGDPRGYVAKAASSGRWITIGGSKGKDGKRHGGSPVFIKDGKIVKGHPSLTGKKLDNLKGEADHGTHRQQLNAAKQHAKARWHKQARAAGHKPEHLESLATDIKAHHDAFASERKEVLQHARRHSKQNGYGDLARRGRDRLVGGREDDQRGLDEVAADTAAAYPHHFREETAAHGGSHEDQLREMLAHGNPEPMEWDEAYSQAFDHLGEAPAESDYPADWDEPIPKSLPLLLDGSVVKAFSTFHESDHPRGDDGKFVGAGEIDAAKGDKAKSAALRARVTDPGERAKLDAHLGGDGDGKPKSGGDSSGGHDHAADYKANGTRSKAFKSWFGDWEDDPAKASKVVDLDGNPEETYHVRKVFHGAGAKFDAFDPDRAGSNGAAAGKGFYFAENRKIAEQYAETQGGPIIEAYLNIRNPYDFDSIVGLTEQRQMAKAAAEIKVIADESGPDVEKDLLRSLGKRHRPGDPQISGHSVHAAIADVVGRERVNLVLQALGYDGILHEANDIYGSPRAGLNGSGKGRVWVVFEPTQVKATDNSGTFDPTSTHIRKSFGRSPLLLDWGAPYDLHTPPAPGRATQAPAPQSPPTPWLIEKADWEESKHPRDHGKFSHTAGGTATKATTSAKASPAPRTVDRFPDPPKSVRQLSFASAEAWATEHYHDWLVGLDEDQRNALRSYATTDACYEINSALRGGESLPAHLADQMAEIDRALEVSTVPETVAVYRGLKTAPPGLRAGAVFHNHGFVSTALNFQAAEHFANMGEGHVIQIVVPKGARGAALGPLADWGGESELLLSRSSRFRVKDVVRIGDYTIYQAELISNA